MPRVLIDIKGQDFRKPDHEIERFFLNRWSPRAMHLRGKVREWSIAERRDYFPVLARIASSYYCVLQLQRRTRDNRKE